MSIRSKSSSITAMAVYLKIKGCITAADGSKLDSKPVNEHCLKRSTTGAWTLENDWGVLELKTELIVSIVTG